MSYPDPVDTLARTQRLLMQAQARIKVLERELRDLKASAPAPKQEVQEVPPAVASVPQTPEVADTESVPEVPKKKKKNGPTE